MSRFYFCLNMLAFLGFCSGGLMEIKEQEKVSWNTYVTQVQECAGTLEEVQACTTAKWDTYLSDSGLKTWVD